MWITVPDTFTSVLKRDWLLLALIGITLRGTVDGGFLPSGATASSRKHKRQQPAITSQRRYHLILPFFSAHVEQESSIICGQV